MHCQRCFPKGYLWYRFSKCALKIYFRNISCTFLLTLFFSVFQVLAIRLIASSNEISIVKPCDLEKALDSLGLGVTSPCTNNDIKEKSTSLCHWGIGLLVVNFILFIMISFFKLMSEKLKLALFFLVSTCTTTAISTFSFLCINTIHLVT